MNLILPFGPEAWAGKELIIYKSENPPTTSHTTMEFPPDTYFIFPAEHIETAGPPDHRGLHGGDTSPGA